MLDLFFQLWTALQSATPEAVVNSLIVLVCVVSLRLLSVLPSSTWARAANIVLSTLLSNALSGVTNGEEVLLLTMTSLFASGLWELITRVYQYFNSQVKPFANSK